MQGTIKKLVSDKNFGFIGRDGETKDLFFHATALEGVEFSDLKEGDMVEFEIVDNPKGPAAAHVKKA